MASALLDDDGRGYELARKLENHGVWRTWLGDSAYSSFVHFLSSPSSWDAFMRADDSKSRAQIQLQLRARALLFDKATAFLLQQSNHTPNVVVSKLNPAYLQLHGDDVYYTLEGNALQDASNAAFSKSQYKSGYGFRSRFGESEADNLPQRFRNEELPETWYSQFIEKYKLTRPYRLSFGDKELDKRTPEGMSIYVRLHEKLKRRRIAFMDDQLMGHGNSVLDDTDSIDDGVPVFPETMFTLNSVPDTPLSTVVKRQNNPKMEFYGVLDSLPQVNTRNPVMLERLGIRPEILGFDRGARKIGVDGNKKCLGKEQASQISQKVVARMLTNVGFEGVTEVPLEVFSQLLGCHVGKLGNMLKVLADGYRKQCSAVELIKMFLQTAGYSNVGVLAELVKDGTRTVVQQPQQSIHGNQSQLQPPHQSPIGLPQQIPRQIHPQMQQMLQSQVTFQQQQLDRMQQHQQIDRMQQQQQLDRIQQQQQLERMQQQQQLDRMQQQQQLGRMQQQQQQQQQLDRIQQQQQLDQMQQQQQQQQLDRLQRRQPSAVPRAAMEIDKVRPLVQVKVEAPSELQMDNANTFNPINARYSQMQFRNQQQQSMGAMSNFHATQNSNQFRQLASLQVPQIRSPTIGMARPAPVKVEGFQELMGGNSSSKHDSEENKMTSPLSK